MDGDNGETGKFIKFLVYSLALFIFGAMVLFIVNVDKILKDDSIPNNVFFLGENLGGMKRDVAVKRVKTIINSIENRNLTLCFGEKLWMLNPKKDFDFIIEKDGVINQLLSIGNVGTILSRIRIKLRLYTGRDKIKLGVKYFYNKEKLNLLSELISISINREPTEAEIIESPPYKRIVREKEGYNITSTELSSQILKALEKTESYRCSTLFIKVRSIAPNIGFTEKLKQLNCVPIEEFSISLPEDSQRRVRVIASSSILDGLILTGGSKLSANALFSGLEKKKYIKKSGDEKEIGYFPEYSGIDIMASALYNISLVSGFEILKRYPHKHVNLEKAYVKIGRDAFIDLKIIGKNIKDLVIRNRKGVNTLFVSKIAENKLIIKTYSSKPLPAKIELISKNITMVEPDERRYIDRSLARGKREIIREGLSGVKVTTMKKIIRKDGQTDIFPVSEDFYLPITRDVKVGGKSN